MTSQICSGTMKLLCITLFVPCSSSSLAFPSSTKIFLVDRFGAIGDGKHMDTSGIQAAIDAAARVHGTVVFRPGTYLTGSIFIKSGVVLQIDQQVTLRGSQRIADYPMLPTRVAGIEMIWPAALVNIYEQSRVAVRGKGTVDGDGKIFWDRYWDLRNTYEPRGLRWGAHYDAMRRRLIQVYKSGHVSLGGGLHLRRSGFWTVHICYSSKVTVDGVIIRNNDSARGPSTDGIDIDSSRQVLVAHADISVNDDALCLKAGRDADGLRVNLPTHNVVVRDSIIREGAAGVTFGSETSGGFRNIEVYRLKVFGPVPVGILFKSAKTRGGIERQIRIHDLSLTEVPVVLRITMNWNPSYSYAQVPPDIGEVPSYWKVLTQSVSASQGIPHLQNVAMSNTTATGAKVAFEVDAFAQAPLSNFTFSDIRIQAATAGHIADADDWSFAHVDLTTADGSVVALTDDHKITGISSRQGQPSPTDARDTPKSSAEQDKN